MPGRFQLGDLMALTVRSDRRPGDNALIVTLHAEGYAPLGPRFAGVAEHVDHLVQETVLDGSDRSCVFFAELNGEAIACAAMIDRGNGGQLRWVVALPEARGLGAGRAMLDAALAYARTLDWPSVYLETTDGLEASMALYTKAGFNIISDEPDEHGHGFGRHIVMRKTL